MRINRTRICARVCVHAAWSWVAHVDAAFFVRLELAHDDRTRIAPPEPVSLRRSLRQWRGNALSYRSALRCQRSSSTKMDAAMATSQAALSAMDAPDAADASTSKVPITGAGARGADLAPCVSVTLSLSAAFAVEVRLRPESTARFEDVEAAVLKCVPAASCAPGAAWRVRTAPASEP